DSAVIVEWCGKVGDETTEPVLRVDHRHGLRHVCDGAKMLAGLFAMRRQHKTLLAAGAGLDAESQLLQSGTDLGAQPALLRLDRYRDAGGGIKQPRDQIGRAAC